MERLKWEIRLLIRFILKPFKDIITYIYGFFVKKRKLLFILGHMRSRSTLLFHIINSNKQCFGVGETNRVYNSQFDITRHLLACQRVNKTKIETTSYLIDQINHNRMTPNLDLFNQSNTTTYIILIRNPLESIQSMMKTFNDRSEKMTEALAIDYYKTRLRYLKSLISKLEPQNYIIISSENLINQTENTLSKISTLLNLNDPLKTTYSIHYYTGKRGDNTSNIKSGEISKKPKQHNYEIKTDIKDLFLLYDSILCLS